MADFIRFSVPGKPEYVGTVRLAVSSVASTAGFNVEDIEDIKVAVSEVCTSVFCRTRTVISYQVDCELEDNAMIISICDDENSEACRKAKQERLAAVERLNSPADTGETSSDSIPEISGYELGLMLVKALMDEVDISSRDEDNMLVRMIKYFG